MGSMDLIVARRVDAIQYACKQPPAKGTVKLTWDEVCRLTETACNKLYRDTRGADSEVTVHVVNSTWRGRTKELADITYHISKDRGLAAMPDPSEASCTHIPPRTPGRAKYDTDLSLFSP
jgi:hypothetical protein